MRSLAACSHVQRALRPQAVAGLRVAVLKFGQQPWRARAVALRVQVLGYKVSTQKHIAIPHMESLSQYPIVRYFGPLGLGGVQDGTFWEIQRDH